ncbi:hypothetical protein CAter282_0582 [Collimonas arenae]|uniref:Uncharacterized protein n=1 Tax=Collimonas arenae TaxID=279058 RepID=A0A127QFI9_9BURK|nr:hypothetical protein CAter282_0582 [Collimonas arenae]
MVVLHHIEFAFAELYSANSRQGNSALVCPGFGDSLNREIGEYPWICRK